MSENQFELAYALRRQVGADSVGIGPDLSELLPLVEDMPPETIAHTITELESYGFLRVNRATRTQDQPGPRELGGVVSVTVLEPLQQYFDDRGL